MAIDGPALLIEPHQTIVVEPGWRAEVRASRCLVLTRVGERPAAQTVLAPPELIEALKTAARQGEPTAGVVLLGGRYEGTVAGVFLLRWDAGRNSVVRDARPSFAPQLLKKMRYTRLASSADIPPARFSCIRIWMWNCNSAFISASTCSLRSRPLTRRRMNLSQYIGHLTCQSTVYRSLKHSSSCHLNDLAACFATLWRWRTTE